MRYAVKWGDSKQFCDPQTAGERQTLFRTFKGARGKMSGALPPAPSPLGSCGRERKTNILNYLLLTSLLTCA